MSEVLRVHIKMPKIVYDGYFEAWLDNDDKFVRDDFKAKLFYSYEDIMQYMCTGTKSLMNLIQDVGCEFEIEFFDQQCWQPHHTNIEKHLIVLCGIV